jgi:hypothetical protein
MSLVQASYPSRCTPNILDYGALPLRRSEHSFASFREVVKTRESVAFAIIAPRYLLAEKGTFRAGRAVARIWLYE